MIRGPRPYTMPEMVRSVIETSNASGRTIAQCFEQTCRQYHIDDGKKDDLRHDVMEFLRMVRTHEGMV